MTTERTGSAIDACPCGSKLVFEGCCGRYLIAGAVPPTAVDLMRSRYCGFVLQDEAYLLATWHPKTRPPGVNFDHRQRWLGLRIRSTAAGGAGDTSGCVEFIARYKINGKGHRLHEKSRFEKIDGHWYYLDGTHH